MVQPLSNEFARHFTRQLRSTNGQKRASAKQLTLAEAEMWKQ